MKKIALILFTVTSLLINAEHHSATVSLGIWLFDLDYSDISSLMYCTRKKLGDTFSTEKNQLIPKDIAATFAALNACIEEAEKAGNLSPSSHELLITIREKQQNDSLSEKN